ncbi:hypothetical protein HDF16_004181 [Granulicella aggregans]|uniref:Spermatogenesis-associated protein 20-like TRX domain-containing protein n=1 Tax=Granulicella aggregans TaxID=474949 RepID=A0A7W7ZGF2_9BACT|nr:thioredoxin domain-containing protein [Granulicella aggregans]MBB5059455.1 hypothetical protein [Granulicella aggregans]
MSSEQVNGLAKAASAYLRSAMHQPVDWQEWGPEAFAKAQAEDKPILLDIGAVWCHWCHVMDRESYEDPLTAQIINDHYIAVKVDRDERPDVDTRYQAAVASISGQGGWPLTAFLTPAGLPYFGGTYFPPKDQHGRPSMQRVLLTMAEAFQKRRGEVDESAESVLAAIEENETFNETASNPGAELHAKLIAATLKQFDARNGGFGGQPKFPHPGAIDMLLDAASRTNAIAGTRDAALITLEKMAKGGVYDHLAGGFHRYSVDERWVVPHFEKMAYDNSELLKNYVHAYQSFGAQECARVAFETMQWIDEWLSDQDRGGFYASQDADFSLEDDGDYFTWTRAEAAAALSREELAIAGPWFDIGELGDMHHNPQKNVLHILQPLAAVAKSARVTEDDATALLASAKRKLYAARLARPTPFIDKTLYTAWNGMCISAYLETSRVLRIPEARAFALKSLDRVLDSAWSSDASMAHVVAYADGLARASRVAGGLEDYVFIGHAALDAWETTGELKYYTAAEQIAASTVTRFYDTQGNGFFDTESLPEGEQRPGVLGTRRKPLQDSPTPAGNPVAASLLLRVAALNGSEDYSEKAKLTLENFAGMVEHLGLYAAGYALALQRMIQPPVQICVVGEDALADELEGIALARFVVNKSVIRLRRDQLGSLPPALAETIPNLPSTATSIALVCTGRSCLPPVSDAEGLIAALATAI